MREPFLALPRGRDAWVGAAAALVVVVAFAVFYGCASWASGYVPWSVSLLTPLEGFIPFVPATAIVYLSMDLLVGLAPFVLRRARDCVAFAATMVAQTLVASVVFVLLPVADELPARVVATGTLVDPIFAMADTMNLERNYFPSLHVAFAVTAALVFAPRAGSLLRVGLFAWAAAIAASTLLLHEHYVLDVAAGAALAVLAVRLVYRPLATERAWSAIVIEACVLLEIVRMGRRHPRYLVIGAALYRASVGHFASRRVLRTGFCFLQALDDILDGDLEVRGDPEAVVDALVSAAERRAPGDGRLERLGAAFFTDLEGLPSADARWQDVRGLVETMKRDHRRARDRELLSQGELRAQLRATFAPSVDLMLAAGGSPVRAADVPSLIEAFAWCSVVRDLDEDLRHGLVNVPREVVLRSGVELDQLASAPATLEWLESERERALAIFDHADAEIDALGDRSAQRVLALFARSIRRYGRRGRRVAAEPARA